jgi:hypothetical protein
MLIPWFVQLTTPGFTAVTVTAADCGKANAAGEPVVDPLVVILAPPFDEAKVNVFASMTLVTQ